MGEILEWISPCTPESAVSQVQDTDNFNVQSRAYHGNF